MIMRRRMGGRAAGTLLLAAAIALATAPAAVESLDGLAECAGCNTPDLKCRGRTIMDEHCAPCATGQTWWPCNVNNECYCENLAEASASETAAAEAKLANDCDMPLCQPIDVGNKVVPFTNCEQYVQCAPGGIPGTVQSCAPGQAFSARINACNVKNLVDCPPDPTCPPTGRPTAAPTTATPTYDPTGGPRPPTRKPTAASPPSTGEGVHTDSTSQRPPPMPDANYDVPRSQLDPMVLEGIYVMDAHLAANKIALTRELLSSPSSSGRPYPANANDFSYVGFRDSLHTMITAGVDGRTFYIGHSSVENGRAYGLVNIAAFLAMSHEDSVTYGSCDEVNYDLVGGLLPVSNACGQNGMSYQDMSCPAGEEMYDCAVDANMRTTANVIDTFGTGSPSGAYGGSGDIPPKPFYCGPKGDYEGYTGHYDYVTGMESVHPPVENSLGRTDVEG